MCISVPLTNRVRVCKWTKIKVLVINTLGTVFQRITKISWVNNYMFSFNKIKYSIVMTHIMTFLVRWTYCKQLNTLRKIYRTNFCLLKVIYRQGSYLNADTHADVEFSKWPLSISFFKLCLTYHLTTTSHFQIHGLFPILNHWKEFHSMKKLQAVNTNSFQLKKN